MISFCINNLWYNNWYNFNLYNKNLRKKCFRSSRIIFILKRAQPFSLHTSACPFRQASALRSRLFSNHLLPLAPFCKPRFQLTRIYRFEISSVSFFICINHLRVFSSFPYHSPIFQARFRLASSPRCILQPPQSAAMYLSPDLSAPARAVPRASFTRLMTGAVAPLRTTLRVRWVSASFTKFPPARHAQNTQSIISVESAKSSCIPGFPCSPSRPRRPRTPATPRPCEIGTAFTRGLGGASKGLPARCTRPRNTGGIVIKNYADRRRARQAGGKRYSRFSA